MVFLSSKYKWFVFHHHQWGSCQRYEIIIWDANLKAQPSSQDNKLVGNNSIWKEHETQTQEFSSVFKLWRKTKSQKQLIRQQTCIVFKRRTGFVFISYFHLPWKYMPFLKNVSGYKGKECALSTSGGVPVVAQQVRHWHSVCEMQVRSLASLSGLGIWCCRGVALAGSCSSNSAPIQGTSICLRCGCKINKWTNKQKTSGN